MNEELKIIIRASTADAQRNLAAVREELGRIDDTSTDAGKSVDNAMKSVAKGAAVAVGAIVALTTAIVTLGKKSLEFQKQQAKLIAGFQAAGSSAQQANETYANLFRFLGDTDTATEAAQSLARITTSQQELAEWTTILQGVYARAGNAIPIESLAEAANETIQVGQVTGAMADALNWLGVSEDAFNEKLAATTSLEEREVLLRSTLNSLYGNAANIYEKNNQALIRYNESQANLDIAMANAAKYTVPLMTSLNNLGASFLTVLAPSIEVVAVYLTGFIQLISEAIQWVGSFFGMFSSSTEQATADVEGYRNAMNNYISSLSGGFNSANDSIADTSASIEKLKKQTMGFDELNVVQSQTSASIGGGGATGGGGGSIGGITPPNAADFGIGVGGSTMLEDVKKDLEEAKEKIKVFLGLVAAVGVAFAAWKIGNIIKDLILINTSVKKLKELDLMVEASQAMDRIDILGEKLKSVGGIVLIVAGAIALVAGYTDGWVNGIDWGNFAAVLGGVAAIVAGLTLKFGATAGGVGALAGGVAMLVLGIKDMIENGASLENILTVIAGTVAVVTGALMLMGKENIKAVAGWIAHTASVVAHGVALAAQKVATVAVTVAQTALNLVMNMSPLGWIITGITAVVAAFVILWNKCEGFRNFWKGLWENVKNIFSSAWTGIKNFFSGVGTFFSGVWGSIKKTFSNAGSTIGDAISGTVSKAISTVLSGSIKLVNGFIGGINAAVKVINAIPGVNIKTLSTLAVPKLAKGGITTGATTAIIGEAGREAVLPLENNTGWMDMLADRIASRNSSPSKIILRVGERDLGYATIGAINNITEQTGSLQLVLQ